MNLAFGSTSLLFTVHAATDTVCSMPSHLARALMTADLPDVTTETETELVEEEHMLAISIATMIFLNILSLGIGQWLHSKHVYWLPEWSAAFLTGWACGACR